MPQHSGCKESLEFSSFILINFVDREFIDKDANKAGNSERVKN